MAVLNQTRSQKKGGLFKSETYLEEEILILVKLYMVEYFS